MENKVSVGLEDLFELFENEISLSDIISAKYLGKISSAIVKKRLELDMNQKEFANYISVSQGMISRWEGGDYNFTIKGLSKLAEKLNMDLYIKFGETKCNVYYTENGNFKYIYSTDNVEEKTGKIINFSERKEKSFKTLKMKHTDRFIERNEM